ncbi:iron-siderophore ABC transporter substrate-binding protein [Nocardioides sp. W7]|uniref:ABC transporter substrate-binding protein n=1 Tax=Nocardioides sp. W7 TaxID=2931390 RepID=UPI001FD36E39|nr:iron-siderophore ABC transporter substrate-binding protein [Nocardioides sp. W7]
MTLLRRALALALLVPLALTAGCGGEDTSVGASDSETRTVVDVEGTSMQVPADPQRVVALSEPTLDGALALGVEPVGTISGRGQSEVPRYLSDLASDIALVGAVAQPDFEKIVALAPDLILVDGTSITNNPGAVEKLRKIAPTFYAGYAGADWRGTFASVAEALNRTSEGEQVVAAYDEQVAAARTELTSYDASTFSIVRWQGGAPSMILAELPAGMALSDLGLRRPPGQDRRGRGHSEPVSLENLSMVDADYLFFGTLGDDASKVLDDARKVPGFDDLTASRLDHVIPVDGSLWTSTGGPLLMSRLVDSVLEGLS